MNRRDFILSAGAAALVPSVLADADACAKENDMISRWDFETERVSPENYRAYLKDGDTRGYWALEKLEEGYRNVVEDIRKTVVTGDRPAIWSVYNMGYVVKTRESLFAIDLVHRRDRELASMLDFALITHKHTDHWRKGFYDAMDKAGKTVISNFMPNSGVKSTGRECGYVRGAKTFNLKDVSVRTSLIDHNPRLIDFTTAFEIKIGDFLLYHTGDSGKGTEPKLNTVWGRPDLWLFFPGCGIDTVKAVKKVAPKRIVFGHAWELLHKQGHRGRFDERLIRRALAAARPLCPDTSLVFWGSRV